MRPACRLRSPGQKMAEIADFTTGFWTGWVVLLTVAGLLFMAFLLYSVFSASGRAIRSEEEVWDETLSEGNSEPPKWWFFLFLGMIIFTCAYLVLYPGLGSYKGVMEWTQFHQYEQARSFHEQRYSEVHRSWETASFEELAADEEAMGTAADLYIDNCSGCHGRDGAGQVNLFPSLVDDEWQWGGSAEEVHASIANGRAAVMVSQTAQLGGAQGVEEMADHVLYLAGLAERPEGAGNAAQMFAQVCAACHGQDGKGNPLLGAPDLTDDVWLYGSDRDTVIATLAHGRNGVMPAQGARLGPARTRLLAAWVASGRIQDIATRN